MLTSERDDGGMRGFTCGLLLILPLWLLVSIVAYLWITNR